MTAAKHDFDVVIVGGGAIGSCMALAIQQLLNTVLPRALRVAVVEARLTDSSTAPSGGAGDGRAIALAHQSLRFLSELGLDADICAVSEPIADIHVSEQGACGQCELSADLLQVAELGRVIELHELQRILRQALPANDQPPQHPEVDSVLTWFCPDRVVAIEQGATQAEVHLQSGAVLAAALVLLTDGGDSGTRQVLGLPVQKHCYQQVAMVTTATTSLPHQQRAFERFTSTGPLAVLPMTANRCSVVWTLPEGEQQAWMDASEGDCIVGLQQAFGYRLGTITGIGARSLYPLALHRVCADHLHRIAVLGNAAQTLHPIAGQGFNLGLRDVQVMADLLAQHLLLQLPQAPQAPQAQQVQPAAKPQLRQLPPPAAPGCDLDYATIGEFRFLNHYRQQRSKDVQRTVAATHGLVQIFSNSACLLRGPRNAGLLAMQHAAPLKTVFARQFMGQL